MEAIQKKVLLVVMQYYDYCSINDPATR